MSACTLEVRIGERWHRAARVLVDEDQHGIESPSHLDYEFDYLDEVPGIGARDARAVSSRYPLGYERHDEPQWPAFLLDLMPSGAARRWWVTELGVQNNRASEWSLLVNGAGNPPGNVRVAEAAERMGTPDDRHPGFARDEVIARSQDFLEYARARGAHIAGGTGAGGDAPKFLLREDTSGRWHADGAISDARTAQCWLVKFPRSQRPDDRLVLKNEAAYHRVAARLGARTGRALEWAADCLFVPRFDRVMRDGTLLYLGLESLSSLAGVAELGAATPKDVLASAVANHASDAASELVEFLVRDVLDVALNNTDNHARNTAVLKDTDGNVSLAPIYDFAPMYLDTEGITRVCRWRGERDGFPDYEAVIARLTQLGAERDTCVTRMHEMAVALRKMSTVMADEGVSAEIIEQLGSRIARVAAGLEVLR